LKTKKRTLYSTEVCYSETCTPEGVTTSLKLPGRGVRTQALPAAAAFFYFRPRFLNGTPDKRYEHPLFHALATREPPNSGKIGLAEGAKRYALCPLREGCSGAAKADTTVADIRLVAVADRTRHIMQTKVPRPTAQHLPKFLFIIKILAPFPNIAGAINTAIRRFNSELAHRRCHNFFAAQFFPENIVPPFAPFFFFEQIFFRPPTGAVAVVTIPRAAPRPAPAVNAARRFFPLQICRQNFSGPFAKCLCVIPTHQHDRMLLRAFGKIAAIPIIRLGPILFHIRRGMFRVGFEKMLILLVGHRRFVHPTGRLF